MNWLQLLTLLACPLMMIFCMKGMFSGNKDSKAGSAQANVSRQEIQNLQIKMADLMEQNQNLMKELKAEKGSPSNVVELSEEQSSKRVIS